MSGMSLVGVNLSGAEFGGLANSKYGYSYIYPSNAEIDYYAGKGVNVIRLPFLWERLQPALNSPLNTAELARIDSVVNYAASKGINVVLDPHNYGGYGSSGLVGSANVSNASFANLWGQLGSHFKDSSNVIFGLMNEPNKQSASSWLQSANAAIAAIRQSGARQEVLVPGSYWDGAWTWTKNDNASVIGTGIVDPAKNYAFEVHQYLDTWGSGTNTNVVSASVGVERLTAITQWAEKNGAKLFLGEFGVAQDATSLTALNNMLSYMSDHGSVWQGATYWGAGPWWGNYMYSIEPRGGIDKPQMAILQSYTPAALAAAAAAAGAAAATPTAPVSDVPVPVITAKAVTIALASDTGSSATDRVTGNAALAGGGAANATVHFSVDGTAITSTATANAAGIWHYQPTGLADGTHTIVATESGAAGSSTASVAFTLDTKAPVPVITSAAGTVASATQSLAGTGEAGSTLRLYNGSAALGGAITVAQDGRWSASVSLSGGTNTLTAKTTDTAGNVGVSKAVDYVYNHAPVITSGGGGTNATYVVSTASRAITTVHANDADSGESVSYALLDGTGKKVSSVGKVTIDSRSGALSFSSAPTPGTYAVTAVASDTHGGSAMQTIKVKVGSGSIQIGDTGDHGVTDTFVFNGGSALATMRNFKVSDVTSGGVTDPHSVLALAHTLFTKVAADAGASDVTKMLASHSFQFGQDTFIVTDQRSTVMLQSVNRAALLAHPGDIAFT